MVCEDFCIPDEIVEDENGNEDAQGKGGADLVAQRAVDSRNQRAELLVPQSPVLEVARKSSIFSDARSKPLIEAFELPMHQRDHEESKDSDEGPSSCEIHMGDSVSHFYVQNVLVLPGERRQGSVEDERSTKTIIAKGYVEQE